MCKQPILGKSIFTKAVCGLLPHGLANLLVALVSNSNVAAILHSPREFPDNNCSSANLKFPNPLQLQENVVAMDL